jgi:hypothetical protein
MVLVLTSNKTDEKITILYGVTEMSDEQQVNAERRRFPAVAKF